MGPEAPPATWRAAAVYAAAVLLLVSSLLWTVRYGFVDPWVALAFGGLVAVGELVRTPLPGEREHTPLGAAGALAYALLGSLAGARTHHGVGQVVLVCSGAALVGMVPRLVQGRRLCWDSAVRRVLSVGFAALLFQPFYNHGVLLRHGLQQGPAYSTYIAACAALAAVADVLLGALLSEARFGRALRDEFGALLRIGSAIVATGVVISVAAGEIGLWALPLFSVPLLLTQAGFRRYAAIRATQRQTIASLARATEVAGYTLPGHALRVCALARGVGRELALPESELLLLEYAALMHDIGQLSLVDPIPGGATALLSQEEQRRIGRLGSEVIRRTGVPAQVAEIVARLAEPYRRSDGSRDPGLPMAARIIRAANAYDDLACDDPGPARRAEVLAQLRANTASEYEPRVVEALARVCLRMPG
ncbi:HD domain-containing protein [Streptacidiphilus rugosus]|uniref:HD domain-containing protein n=1 Tax=Streptacidiphilus rugosus TaxID=405783 RepID=UPI000691FDA8|nr:HD domain-containing phosphohydrolase [Streptacidiphilus rugosus]